MIRMPDLPKQHGVYIFKDSEGGILYVGKAIDLRRRVASYFTNKNEPKIKALLGRAEKCDFTIVESELEALLLEANLIKSYKPPFNIKLTDDKDYLYIVISGDVYPKVFTARKQDLHLAKKYFGPFPSGKTVRSTLKRLRRVFPWCQKGDVAIRRGGACFYYHLGLCPGVCAGKCSRREYILTINRLASFLDGKKEELMRKLTRSMQEASRIHDYEKAMSLKKTINGISYLTQKNRVSLYLENPNFLSDERQESMQQLVTDLGLGKVPSRIECFDISNTGGTLATGSMVVFSLGEADKSQYRRFKIKIGSSRAKPNDTLMHREMFDRRLKHKEWPMPEMILVDGGKGQVGVYLQELEKSNLSIPVFGLAKRMEWVYPGRGGVCKIPKDRLSVRLLQKIRDEAHRFAVSYHRKLREESLYRVV